MGVLTTIAAVPLAAGCLCVASGLWMMLRGQGSAAFVLLVGAGLLAVPFVLRSPAVESAAAPEPVAALPVGIGLSTDGLQTVAAPVAQPPPPLPGRPAVRIDIEASEAEPNDTLASANAAGLGTAIVGSLAAGDLDYYAVDIPPGRRSDLLASLLVLDGDAGLTVFDDAGRALGSADTSQQISVRSTTLERQIDRPRYVVLVRGVPPGASATYQLTIASRPR